MRAIITGGAGCIGSELAAALLARGDSVVVIDNFSSGREEHLAGLPVEVIRADLLDKPVLPEADVVFHLAANPDVRGGGDLEQNVVATYNVLEAARVARISQFVFTSSSAVYGLAGSHPIPESHPLQPISLYGATKAGAEALISAYAHLYGMQARIFRLANIVGRKVRRRGRTVISDFIAKLTEHPRRLEILGDGRQAKSYLSTAECIEAMLFAMARTGQPMAVLNAGGSDRLTVTRIAELVVEAMGLQGVEFAYTGGQGGWPGDVPHFLLDVSAINGLGWRARLNSEESVRRAIAGTLAAASGAAALR
ncbi:MAG TPA: NAD-dependent epimerase/dehydratase family protein [Bryobacteraceae bacterium]|nr:NAD-dependent epimerase/dehydratase family protein [Bryobacteraceae bacterium]